MTLGFASYSFLPLLGPSNAYHHVLMELALFLLWVLAFPLLRKVQQGRFFYILLLLGLGFHLLLFVHHPSMSDDFFRYIWDGRMQYHGINPFRYAPNDLALVPLRDTSIHPYINHPQFPTVYPPIAQMLFLVSYVLHPTGPYGLKLLLLLSEGIAIGLLVVWLKRRGLPIGGALVVAWCPLPVFELMLDAHVDGFALPFLVAGLLALQARRPGWVGVWMACAVMVKPLPLFLMPALCWHFRWRRAFWMLAVFFGLIGLLYLPYLSVGPSLFTQIRHYSKHWYFNSASFFSLKYLLGNGLARTLLALVVICTSIGISFTRLPMHRKLVVPFAVYMLFTPTLYPWYLLWLMPWLVLAPRSWLLWFVSVVSVSHTVHYFFLHNGVWDLPNWLLFLEFAPIFLLFFLSRFMDEGWREPLREMAG
jgi:hypothetical protein